VIVKFSGLAFLILGSATPAVLLGFFASGATLLLAMGERL
jgi:hypothetical protein